MSAEKRDPIKQDPLPDPGQSLREQLDGHFHTRIGAWLMAPAVAVIFTIMEWYRWAVSARYMPMLECNSVNQRYDFVDVASADDAC